ncbi:MAG: alanine dehydrogenase [Bernardetiaceae bacterium]
MSDTKQILEEYEVYLPQETLAPLKEGQTKLCIGIPKEIAPYENRVPLHPGAVGVLRNNGHEVIVQTGAGERSKHTDREYSEAGGRIAYSAKEIYSRADILLKVAPPTIEEVDWMQSGKTLISALQPATIKPELLQRILDKRLTALAYELLKDQVGNLSIMRAMSEIAGSTVLLIAAEYLNSTNSGKGMIIGGITGVAPANIVILGAGTVGEYAARTALHLGGNVKVFDNDIHKLRRMKYHLAHPNIYTSILDTETLREALERADVAIGALSPVRGRTPVVVSEEMVSRMKSDAVILDVSIDHGGCFETSEPTTHARPVFRKYDVIHYCVPNIPSRVARTATSAISNVFTPLLLKIAEHGDIESMIADEPCFSEGVYAYKGNLTNINISNKFHLRYKDINLLMAARRGRMNS